MRLGAPLKATIALGVAALAAGGCGGGNEQSSAPAHPRATTATTGSTTAPTTTQRTATTTTTTTTQPKPSSTPAPASGGTVASGECGHAQGGFLTRISGLAVSCPTARGTALAWFRTVQSGSDPHGTIRVGGFTCRSRFAGETATVRCTRGSSAVRFRASP